LELAQAGKEAASGLRMDAGPHVILEGEGVWSFTLVWTALRQGSQDWTFIG